MDLADIVEDDLRPRWRQALGRLNAVKKSPAANAVMLEKMSHYFELRDQSWELLVEAIRQQDGQKMEQYEEKSREADRLAESVSGS